jgi:hypothetical protein
MRNDGTEGVAVYGVVLKTYGAARGLAWFITTDTEWSASGEV